MARAFTRKTSKGVHIFKPFKSGGAKKRVMRGRKRLSKADKRRGVSINSRGDRVISQQTAWIERTKTPKAAKRAMRKLHPLVADLRKRRELEDWGEPFEDFDAEEAEELRIRKGLSKAQLRRRLFWKVKTLTPQQKSILDQAFRESR